LLTASQFQQIVSGRREGPWAGFLRMLFGWAEVPYGWVVRRRNNRYDRGAAEVCRVDVPVISVGNLTLGGTGKTPMVEWIVRRLQATGISPAIVSRGYGATAGRPNDEALELAQKLPGVPHIQGADRVAAAQRAIREFAVQAIVLDDAFQHRRIARDFDLVMLDAVEPFGYGHLFPRGMLREPLDGLARAAMVVLSRVDMVPEDRRAQIRAEVKHWAPAALWAETIHAPRALVASDGREEPAAALAEKPVIAFCGLGNPTGFRHTLRISGYRLMAYRRFADHYGYTRADIKSLEAWADGWDVAAVLCSQKDLVKLNRDHLGRHPLRAVSVELKFLSGENELEEKLRGLFPKA
jgi:tetraacyldisaccharide 4'-kinase